MLDVAHLTGLLILGNPIHALLEPPKVTFTLNTDMRYTDFSKKYKGKLGSLVQDKERTAFYLLWLCEFLFCVPGYKITKEYLPFALCVQDGQLMALAPYLLATLYKALFSFVDKKISGNCGGPFWLFQAWLYAYFPKARPPQANTLKLVFHSYVEQLLTYNSQPILTFRNHLTMFYNLPSKRPSNLYMPFQNFQFSSSRLRFLFTDPSDLHNEQVQEQNEAWRHILTSRHVLVGCSTSSTKMSNCSFETYCPNQWSRQLGLSQGIPYPYFHPTIHEEIGSRIYFKDPRQAESILTENTKLFQDFGPFFIKPTSDCSTAFDHWWGLMTAIIFCKPLETWLHNTCIHNQGPISSPSKLKATAKIGPAAKPLVRDQHKGKAPMDPTTQTNTPSAPQLMRKRRRLLLTAADDEDPSTSPQHIHPIPNPISNVPREPTVQPTPPPPEASQQTSLQPASQSSSQQSTQSASQHPSTSPQHIDPIPSPITNVPREPTVEPTPTPPQASQQTSLQPPSQSLPQQSTQSASHNPSQLEPPPIALRDVTVGAVSMEVDCPGGTEPIIVPSVFSPQPSPSNPSNSQTSNKESERIDFDISINSQSSPTDDNTKFPQPEVHNNQGMDIIHDSSPRPMSAKELEGPHDFPLLAELEKEPEGTDAAISSVPETTPPAATTAVEQGQPSARTLSRQDVQTKKDFLNEAHTISTSLKLSQQTSIAILEQHSALELKETKLMAELASVRQRKAHLQQQHDQLNQEARMMLSQIRHRSASIQTTKAELDQAQAMLADAQSEWGVLAILFPKS
ncbi:uncharacterized protein LOC114316745 [Camellia sinensis]|uniref:uncharacterized protein LOC114316745 n=1 Tax=Camellia sinensis TaxID=4442 RepID=UPI001036BF1C|nr:uncharacterized protein LOC114316745 [Camellia sinensis]